jgi:hypothetical protein
MPIPFHIFSFILEKLKISVDKGGILLWKIQVNLYKTCMKSKKRMNKTENEIIKVMQMVIYQINNITKYQFKVQ